MSDQNKNHIKDITNIVSLTLDIILDPARESSGHFNLRFYALWSFNVRHGTPGTQSGRQQTEPGPGPCLQRHCQIQDPGSGL